MIVSFAQQYNVEIIGLKNGLFHFLVTGMDQGSQGTVWLSTGGGLCNHNGYEFKYLTTRDGLNYTRLTDVSVNAQGNFGVSSVLGLNMIGEGRILTISKDKIGKVIYFGKLNNGSYILTNRGGQDASSQYSRYSGTKLQFY